MPVIPTATTEAAPASAKPKFGAQQKCVACGKTVYLTEKVVVDEKIFHKVCLKCSECKKVSVRPMKGVKVSSSSLLFFLLYFSSLLILI
tara:strand:- start:310 stop:576 length:267 start_codon:yes stop_codon:yes gene_type:complete